MASEKVAMRYAKSLFSLAEERNEVAAIHADMAMFAEVVRENHDLAAMLRSPIIGKEKKIKVLDAIFTGKVSELSSKFLALITRKGREGALVDISEAFAKLFRKANGIIQAHINSAVALDDATKQQIIDTMNLSDYSKVEYIETVDPDLVGGYVVRVEDKQINASVSRQLKDIKQKLVSRD